MLDNFRLQRVGDIQGPDDALVPSLGIVRHERELALVIDPEAMGTAAWHVVEPGLF